MSAGQNEEWPRKLVSRDFQLVRLQPDHVNSVWPLLLDTQNARLFRRIYGLSCSTSAELEALVHDETRGRIHYALYTGQAQKPIGWNVLSHIATDVLEVAFFLSYEARIPSGSRAFFPVCTHAFDVLGLRRIEFWWGSLRISEGQAHPNETGLSFSAVVGRQLLVAEDLDGDHHSITVEKWRTIGPVFDTWDASVSKVGEAR